MHVDLSLYCSYHSGRSALIGTEERIFMMQHCGQTLLMYRSWTASTQCKFTGRLAGAEFMCTDSEVFSNPEALTGSVNEFKNCLIENDDKSVALLLRCGFHYLIVYILFHTGRHRWSVQFQILCQTKAPEKIVRSNKCKFEVVGMKFMPGLNRELLTTTCGESLGTLESRSFRVPICRVKKSVPWYRGGNSDEGRPFPMSSTS